MGTLMLVKTFYAEPKPLVNFYFYFLRICHLLNFCLLIQIPSYRIRHMMNRLFLTSPSLASQSGWKGPATLLLSTYSHYSFLHYMFNMLAFFSFGLALLNGRDTPRTVRSFPLAFTSTIPPFFILHATNPLLF